MASALQKRRVEFADRQGYRDGLSGLDADHHRIIPTLPQGATQLATRDALEEIDAYHDAWWRGQSARRGSSMKQE